MSTCCEHVLQHCNCIVGSHEELRQVGLRIPFVLRILVVTEVLGLGDFDHKDFKGDYLC